MSSLLSDSEPVTSPRRPWLPWAALAALLLLVWIGWNLQASENRRQEAAHSEAQEARAKLEIMSGGYLLDQCLAHLGTDHTHALKSSAWRKFAKAHRIDLDAVPESMSEADSAECANWPR
jgi:hypothetical protein